MKTQVKICLEHLCSITGERDIKLYPASLTELNNLLVMMVKIQGTKQLFAKPLQGGSSIPFEEGYKIPETEHSPAFLCPLTHKNRLILNQLLPHTLPKAFGREVATFGTGDRLGLASPGHILAFSGSHAKPILAQQSKRELNLTGRNYRQVLDDVCFLVFQEGYKDGFGADGDHLKFKDDIKEALDLGYTMITLDCSDYINNNAECLSFKEQEKAFKELPTEYRLEIQERYLSKGFNINGEVYHFTQDDLTLCALVYKNAIEYVSEVYEELIRPSEHQVDFELSIDETQSVTTALAHLFVANELTIKDVKITSLAPRFIGEFQKGIDYIGNLQEFTSQVSLHGKIADYFGYKLSIHSGSDKFAVFPQIGTATKGRLHVKTSGTSWLEALRIIARHEPKLYRDIHQKALTHFEEAKTFYHVSAEISQIRPLNTVDDDELEKYLEQDSPRQLLHITYGYILGDEELESKFYNALEKYEDIYKSELASHIGRHLDEIGLRRTKDDKRQ